MTYGKFNYATVLLDDLVVLPQVRKITNSKIDELIDSIESKGLINLIDVAKMDYNGLKNHIEFINRVWKTKVNINSFKPAADGYYYVVIAGHSRLIALKEIAKRHNRVDDMIVKIHDVKSSEEILAIQLDENIHKEVNLEERAIAIIETYFLGICNGKWKDKADFIKKNQNKFSKGILYDALVFADLPKEVQDYVFSNNIPFSIGVELGKMLPFIVKYESDFESNPEQLEKNIRLYWGTLLIRMQGKKSIKQMLTLISGELKTMSDYFLSKEEQQQEQLDWFNDGTDRQSKEHRQQRINDYNKALKSLKGLPFEYFVEVLTLDQGLTGIDHAKDISSVQKLYCEHINDDATSQALVLKKK